MTCIGYKNKLKRQEYLDRSLQYSIIAGYADPKKLPKIHIWWPIEGEPQPKGIKFTKAKIASIKKFHDFIKGESWIKNKNG